MVRNSLQKEVIGHRGVPRIFHWGQDREAKGRERGWVLGEWAATPLPPPRGSGARCELLQRGSGRAPTARRFFTIFSTRMASPGTIILFVEYHAAIVGQDPVLPCVRP